MAMDYSRTLLRVAVAQICQSLGWNAVQSTPMELLTDVMERYLQEVGKCAHRYSEQFGRTEPNLDSVVLAFQDLGISLSELEDYAQHVEPVPFALDVPKFPAPKGPLLSFPKPNSRELQNREEHIDEFLPPMHPEWDEEIPTKSPRPLTPTAGATLIPPEEGRTQQSPQAGGLPAEKRAAVSPAEAAPPAKKLKSLPDEAGHSQYLVKRVGMSSSGLLIGTSGILPDARTPPPPTPQTPKPVVVPFPNIDDEPSIPASPKVLKSSVISETVEERTSIGGVNTDNISSIRAENMDKMPLPKSPRGGKVPPKSPRPGQKSPKIAKKSPKSPKGSPRIPKSAGKSPKTTGGKSPKAGKSPKGGLKPGKVPKSPKIKKIKTPKPGKSPKGAGLASPKLGKSPKPVKEKDSVGTVKIPKIQRSPGRGKAKSPRKPAAIKVEEIYSNPEPVEMPPMQSPPLPSSIETALPVCMRSPSPPAQVLDLSMPKMEIRTKAAMKDMQPHIMEEHGFISPTGQYVETTKAKECRLASYDDAIETVLQMTSAEEKPVVMLTPKQEPEFPYEQFPFTPEIVKPEKSEKSEKKPKSEKKTKKARREADITDTIDKVIAGHDDSVGSPPHPPPPPAVIKNKPSDIYAFPPQEEPVSSSPAAFPSPVSTPKSEKKKDKSKTKDKKSKLLIKIPELASTPSGEESDASRDRAHRPGRESSFSPSTPKVVPDHVTPEHIRRFSYSPEKKMAPSPKVTAEPVVEEVPIMPPINPIKLDISLPKISIKIPKEHEAKPDKEPKKEKKKKKNKEKDRDREKVKDKKDKHRDKEKKKEKRDKEKKEKHKEESTTTVGGQGFPKLTFKFGGLKTATPTMSVAATKEATPPPPQKQEKLKLVIKPSKSGSSSKSSKQKAKSSVPSPAPTPQRARTPSPVPPPPPPPLPSAIYSSSSPSFHSPTPSPSPSPERPQVSLSPSPSPLHRERSSSPAPSAPTPSPPTLRSPSRSRSPSPMPVLHHHSPLSLSPTITFSPLPSPAPLIELPMSRSPTRSPSPRPPAVEYQGPRRGDVSDKEASPGKQSPADEDEEDEEEGSSSTRMIISETVGTIKDENGETIWICPACKLQDDGSPMIGCDKCDDWYHWPCVNIKKEPPEEQKWFCPRCRLLTGKPDKKRKPIKAKPGRKKTKNKK